MNKTKEIQVQIIKTPLGYSVTNKQNNTVDLFEDDNIGRKALVSYLIEEVFNRELENGRSYHE